jgi:mannose-1-phosphate guanylyltransferase/mannose-6-phosphate isomerase
MEEKVVRPWGTYQNIYRDEGYQVKRITVNVGGQLSLQSHKHRAENWVIVQGIATVICGEKTLNLTKGESVFIPVGAKHRASNFGTEEVVFIEVQNGDYLGEDDIVRYEDVYVRK